MWHFVGSPRGASDPFDAYCVYLGAGTLLCRVDGDVVDCRDISGLLTAYTASCRADRPQVRSDAAPWSPEWRAAWEQAWEEARGRYRVRFNEMVTGSFA